MSSPIEAEESECGYENDIDTPADEGYLKMYSGYDNPPVKGNLYESLDDRTKENVDNDKLKETSETLEVEERANDIKSHRCSKCPPSKGWILIAIGVAVLGVLIGLLVVYSQKTCPGEEERIKQQSGDCPLVPLMHTTVNLSLSANGVNVRVDCVTGATLPGGFKNYETICSNRAWTVAASCAFVDCLGAYNNGYRTSGVFRISPNGLRPMMVYCEQQRDLGGWTVIQRRQNGYVSFFRDWNAYKSGFGDVSGEYWLGNDNIHALTAGRGQRLKVEMKHSNTTVAHAGYSEFWIDDEARKYELHISGFRNVTPPGDGLTYHNGYVFSTIDQDNDVEPQFNCALVHAGAWWYRNCIHSNLNGLYKGNSHQGIRWHPFTQHAEALTRVRMMVKTA